MTTVKIDIPDGQAAELKAKATAQGLTLEEWLQKVATELPRQPVSAIDWSQCPAVESVPGKVSGAWVLKDTRMPVSLVFENLELGATVDDIMQWHHLAREQIVPVLEFAARSLDKQPEHEP